MNQKEKLKVGRGKSMNKQELEKSLKRFLKRKLSYTLSLLISFLITGGFAVASELN